MRVVVHHPERTGEDGEQIPASVSAYRLGRITDYVNPITGETTPADEVAATLLAQAKEEFPGQQVELEVLVHNGDETFRDVEQEDGSVAKMGNGDGTSTWVHHEQVPDGAVSPEGTVIKAPELRIAQSQSAAPESTGGEQA